MKPQEAAEEAAPSEAVAVVPEVEEAAEAAEVADLRERQAQRRRRDSTRSSVSTGKREASKNRVLFEMMSYHLCLAHKNLDQELDEYHKQAQLQ